jgi:hypothetical protein
MGLEQPAVVGHAAEGEHEIHEVYERVVGGGGGSGIGVGGCGGGGVIAAASVVVVVVGVVVVVTVDRGVVVDGVVVLCSRISIFHAPFVDEGSQGG